MSNTLPKYNWNLNCLSYGSNLLLKLDIVDILRTQYEVFEEHFRNDDHVAYDGRLPLFIVEMFSKFWKLWIDFPEDLHEVVPESKFHEIFLEMSAFFRSEKGCPTGKLPAPVPEKMVEKAKIDTIHARPNVSAKMLVSGEPHEPKSPTVIESLKILNGTVSQLNSILDIGTFRETTSNSSKKGSPVRDPEDTNFKSSSSSSWVSVDPGKLFKSPTKKDLHCGPCCRALKNKDEIQDHLMSVKHAKNVNLMAESVLLLKGNKPLIILQCERTFSFSCQACDIVQTGTNCLIQHCKSKTHIDSFKNIPSRTPSL